MGRACRAPSQHPSSFSQYNRSKAHSLSSQPQYSPVPLQLGPRLSGPLPARPGYSDRHWCHTPVPPACPMPVPLPLPVPSPSPLPDARLGPAGARALRARRASGQPVLKGSKSRRPGAAGHASASVARPAHAAAGAAAAPPSCFSGPRAAPLYARSSSMTRHRRLRHRLRRHFCSRWKVGGGDGTKQRGSAARCQATASIDMIAAAQHPPV